MEKYEEIQDEIRYLRKMIALLTQECDQWRLAWEGRADRPIGAQSTIAKMVLKQLEEEEEAE